MMGNPFLEFDRKWKLEPLSNAETPIFVLSASWRAGSTLLQRLLCSNGQIQLWGEPYGDSGMIPNMVASAKVCLRPEWPVEGHFPEYLLPDRYQEVYQRPQDYWIANLYPLPDDLRRAHRAFLDQWLAVPAQRHGKSRFGLKEVRLDGVCAQYLQWIYPDAKFVFLVRNPYNAWRSFKDASWYFKYPDIQINRVDAFAKVWLRNMSSFLKLWKGNSAAYFVRFEDLLKQGETLKNLLDHCLLDSYDTTVFTQKIRGMVKPPVDPSTSDLAQIDRICGKLAKQLGYTGIYQHGNNPF